MLKKRIIGIDVARALAVIGRVIVNFKIVFGMFAHVVIGMGMVAQIAV